MKYKSLKFKSKKCIGCRLCEQICSMTHFGVINPSKARISIIRDHEAQKDLALYCHNCVDAPCVQACSVEALSRDPDTNAIIVDTEECIGCQNCMNACPYSAPRMLPDENIIIICDLCNGSPECAKICPENAIEYTEES